MWYYTDYCKWLKSWKYLFTKVLVHSLFRFFTHVATKTNTCRHICGEYYCSVVQRCFRRCSLWFPGKFRICVLKCPFDVLVAWWVHGSGKEKVLEVVSSDWPKFSSVPPRYLISADISFQMWTEIWQFFIMDFYN